MITWDDVTALASELVAVETDAQTIILAYVNSALNTAMFKNDATLRLAQIYLAAHLGTNAIPGSGSELTGPVLSEEVGDIKRTYGDIATSTENGGLETTTYGQNFQFLLRTSRARLPRVI